MEVRRNVDAEARVVYTNDCLAVAVNISFSAVKTIVNMQMHGFRTSLSVRNENIRGRTVAAHSLHVAGTQVRAPSLEEELANYVVPHVRPGQVHHPACGTVRSSRSLALSRKPKTGMRRARPRSCCWDNLAE